MIHLLGSTAFSFLVLAAVFWPLEKLFPARAGQPWLRPRLVTDVAFFLGQYLLWGALVLATLQWTDQLFVEWMPGGWRALVASQPRWLQAIEVLLLCDIGVYWFHRACHRFDFLWRFHAVHHSAEHLDWVAAHREHPLDGLVTQLVCNVPAFALGFPMETLAAVIALRSLWGIFIHSNVRLPLGPLHVLLGSPALHHWHHAKLRTKAQNFANLAPWVDVLFGTYHRPQGEETYPIGLSEEFPRSWLGQILHPIRATLRHLV